MATMDRLLINHTRAFTELAMPPMSPASATKGYPPRVTKKLRNVYKVVTNLYGRWTWESHIRTMKTVCAWRRHSVCEFRESRFTAMYTDLRSLYGAPQTGVQNVPEAVPEYIPGEDHNCYGQAGEYGK